MPSTKLVVKEKVIERGIIAWLKLMKVFAFKVENGAVFDQKRGAFRFNSSTRTRGIPDIIALHESVAYAIEVKSATGRLSVHQKAFLADWQSSGGVAVVARSIDDVEAAIFKSNEVLSK